MDEQTDTPNLLADAYERADFVSVKGQRGPWLRITEAGGLTLVARWVRNDLIVEGEK